MKLFIRRVTRKDRNFTIISNSLFLDPNLSLDAKGFFTLILTLPPHWDFSIAGIAKHARKSKQWVAKILHELIEKGLCIREQIKTGEGKFGGIQYTFIERHSNDKITPLSQCGSLSEIEVAELSKSGIPSDWDRIAKNREPENRTTVLANNTNTEQHKDSKELNQSLSLQPSMIMIDRTEAFSRYSENTNILNQDEHPIKNVDQNDNGEVIEPSWNQVLPLEACATAFLFSRALAKRRAQLVHKAGLRDENHLREFVEAFNSFLFLECYSEKQYQDWKQHFVSWLRLQPADGPHRTSEAFNRQKEKVRQQVLDELYNPGKSNYKPYKPAQKNW